MQTTQHRRAPGVPPQIRHGLTELHAYTMCLDAELGRLEDRITALDGLADSAAEAGELRARQLEIADELDLLRRTISALRRSADPAGRYL
ncbi:MAG TPA: hypothetical protein VE127_03625 [Solirubrobacteraceae bacterium]|nr:hypothetical protein [Solirubrobacteraceae bacterium]